MKIIKELDNNENCSYIFNKDFKYDEYLDEEVRELCNYLNALPGIKTTESCCGHGKSPFRIWFQVDFSKSDMGLFFLIRCCDHRYWEYGNIWKVDLSVGDTWFENRTARPIDFCLNSGNVKGFEAYKQAKSLCKNMKYHLNHFNFKKEYKIDIKKFDL